MPLINSYALWNNKGGVGKSTISFIYEIWHLQLMKQHQQEHLHQTHSLGNG